VVGLLFGLGVATVLPGVDLLLAGLAVSPVALALAVAALLVVVALLRVAPAVERVVSQSLDGPDAVVANAAAGAKLLVGFLAIVIAYRGFAPAVTPTFDAFGIGGLYHLGFLVVGLVVLAAFARRLYRCWGPVTRLLTARLANDTEARPDRMSSDG
jgi:hypothetical protein